MTPLQSLKGDRNKYKLWLWQSKVVEGIIGDYKPFCYWQLSKKTFISMFCWWGQKLLFSLELGIWKVIFNSLKLSVYLTKQFHFEVLFYRNDYGSSKCFITGMPFLVSYKHLYLKRRKMSNIIRLAKMHSGGRLRDPSQLLLLSYLHAEEKKGKIKFPGIINIYYVH